MKHNVVKTNNLLYINSIKRITVTHQKLKRCELIYGPHSRELLNKPLSFPLSDITTVGVLSTPTVAHICVV